MSTTNTRGWKSEIIRSIITLIIAVAGAVATVSMTSSDNDEVLTKAKLDSKVDRGEYFEKCKELKIDIDSKADKGTIEKMSQQIQFLYENEIKKNQR